MERILRTTDFPGGNSLRNSVCLAGTLAVVCGIAVAASGRSWAGGQNQNPRKVAEPKKERAWQPDVVPVEVLTFGKKLEDAASQESKDWVWGYVKSNLRDKDIVPKDVIDAVDERYASASTLARDLGIYLVYYFAQQDDDENQRMISYRIRDIDRETYDIARQLNVIWESAQNRLASTQDPSVSPQERIQRDDEERKLNERLRELGDERQLISTQKDFSRRKMNIYLKLLADAHPKLKDAPPGLMKELK